MSRLAHGESEAEQRVLRGLRLAVATSAVILVLEVVGAYLSHSLSLTVDAVHNLPDILAFVVSFVALRETREGSSSDFSFGRHRGEVFAGILNGSLVLAAGVVFGWEALLELTSHSAFDGPVDAIWLFAVAVPTLALRVMNLRNLGAFPGRVRDLNLRSVIIHLASDIAITAAILSAGVAILLAPGIGWIDPFTALAIAGILVIEASPLLRDGWEVLNERVPRGLSQRTIERSALEVPGVVEVHDLHVWAVCSTLVCLTAHIGIEDMPLHQSMKIVQQLRERMESEFGILHSTFEVECAVLHSA